MREIDIWRTAKILIDSHGQNAWLQAAQGADDALAEGKIEVSTVWTRVWRAVKAMQQKTQKEGEAVN